ncbi:hypothetical protein GCM10007858_24350 [Bradyrhizobium liaoningense]|nr:hypothetical protein GCM10007858_24350 [Bradyrhizobium liaoningense]
MGEIGFRLRAGPDGIALRHGAEAEACDLREDEPHPVSLLSTPGQLGLDVAIDRVLGPDKAVEIEEIGHWIPLGGFPAAIMPNFWLPT